MRTPLGPESAIGTDRRQRRERRARKLDAGSPNDRFQPAGEQKTGVLRVLLSAVAGFAEPGPRAWIGDPVYSFPETALAKSGLPPSGDLCFPRSLLSSAESRLSDTRPSPSVADASGAKVHCSRLSRNFRLSFFRSIPQLPALVHGEVAEWSIAPHSKCGVSQGTVGSNPTLSATFTVGQSWTTPDKAGFCASSPEGSVGSVLAPFCQILPEISGIVCESRGKCTFASSERSGSKDDSA